MEFFIIKDNQQQGPFNLEQLGGMSIMPDTPVWCEGMSDWTVAAQVPELQHLVAYAPGNGNYSGPQQAPRQGSQPPAWNPGQSAEPQYYAPAAGQAPEHHHSQPRKRHTALWVTLAIVALLAVILAVSNPSRQSHCDAIASATKSWSNEKIENMGGTGILGGITKAISNPIITRVVEEIVDVDNYVFCSLGHISLGEKQTTVSFGIMGHVFTFNKEQLDKKIEEVIGVNVNSAIDSITNILGDNNDAEGDTGTADNGLADNGDSQDDDDITAEDRAESTFSPPAQVDTIIKAAGKAAAREGAKIIEKAIDEMFE